MAWLDCLGGLREEKGTYSCRPPPPPPPPPRWEETQGTVEGHYGQVELQPGKVMPDDIS